MDTPGAGRLPFDTFLADKGLGTVPHEIIERLSRHSDDSRGHIYDGQGND